MDIKDNTTLEHSADMSYADELRFPKVRPAILEEEIEKFLSDLTPISQEEIEDDDRLAYILSR